MKKILKNGIIYFEKDNPLQWMAKLGVAASLLLIVIGAIGVVFLQTRVKDSLDNRQQASVDSGLVLVTNTSTGALQVGQPATIEIRANTQNVQTDGVQLVFNVTTATTNNLALTVPSASGLQAAFSQVESTSNGYLVRLIAVPQSLSNKFSSSTPVTIAQLTFTPTSAGTFRMVYDRTSSMSTVAGSNPVQDQLNHIADYQVEIVAANGATPSPTPSASPSPSPSASPTPVVSPTPGVTPSPTPSPTPTVTPSPTAFQDDMYFPNADTQNAVFFFYENGTQNGVAANALVAGRTYRLELPYLLQNNNKSNSQTGNVTMNLYLNNQLLSTTSVPYASIRSNGNGYGGTISNTFTAQSTNTFRLMVDPNNSWAETNESNNSFERSFGTSGTGGVTTKQCNESCSSNSECGINFRCYENRCRLVTNVTSTTCSAPPTGGLQKQCNEYCVDHGDCASGLLCFNNSCRRSNNPDSVSCLAATPIVIQTIAKSCNQICTRNSECATNLRCVNGACRLATNVNSAICAAPAASTLGTKGGIITGEEGVASASTGTQPSPSAVAAATPSPRPSASPSMAVTGSSNATVAASLMSGDISGALNHMMEIVRAGGQPFFNLLLMIGGAILALLFILFLISLLFRRRKDDNEPPQLGGTGRTQTQGEYEKSLQDRINQLRSNQPTTPASTTTAGPAAPVSSPMSTSAPAQFRSNTPAVSGTVTVPPLQPTSNQAPRFAPVPPVRPVAAAVSPTIPATQTPPANVPDNSSMLDRLKAKGINQPT